MLETTSILLMYDLYWKILRKSYYPNYYWNVSICRGVFLHELIRNVFLGNIVFKLIIEIRRDPEKNTFYVFLVPRDCSPTKNVIVLAHGIPSYIA